MQASRSGSERANLIRHARFFLFDIGVRNALLRRPLGRALDDERGLLLEPLVAGEPHQRLGSRPAPPDPPPRGGASRFYNQRSGPPPDKESAMTRALFVLVLAAAPVALVQSAQEPMTFFLTSRGPGDGANLGGLAGADAHCAMLAEEADAAAGLAWRAYLSAAGTDARDRIGNGPWHNANGVMVANGVADLHSDQNRLSKENSVSERGEVISGRGDEVNRHDIITGTAEDGTAFTADGDTTCSDWTSNSADGSARVGHHDRVGGGPNPTSWNSSHDSRGCGQEDLRGTGGDGLFYCFAMR